MLHIPEFFGKIFNCRWVLERMLRDQAMRVDAPSLSTASAQLQDQLEGIRQIDDLDALRGIEGMASAAYFGVFDQLILNQKEVFHFDGRNRRYYKVTEKGMAQLNLYKVEWKNYTRKITEMFEGGAAE